MKVIRCINNNVAICRDSKDKELVAFGKGIGFGKPPYEVEISKIERTYYNMNEKYLSMLAKIDERALQISVEVREYAKYRGIITGENFVFSLADHIDFAVERELRNIKFQLPIETDIQQIFKKEYEVGIYALSIINEKFNISLPKQEASYIALNLLNSEQELDRERNNSGQLVDDIVDTVSQMMKIEIDEGEFSYSRFISHLYYLLQRTDVKRTNIANKMLLDSIRKTNEAEYNCALEVKKEIDKRQKSNISEDEVFYLTLHIARLCERKKDSQDK